MDVRGARTAVSVLCLALAGCLGPQPRHPPFPRGAVPLPPSGKFLIPLPGAHVMSRYGRRGFEFHTGLDLQLSRGGGEPVLASRAGQVVEARRAGGYGRMILLRHIDGFYTRYGHLRAIKVRIGQEVEALQEIGRVGRSGRASGQHLHFEILTPDKRAVDPVPYLFPQ